MFYYKDGNAVHASTIPLDLPQITEEEYYEILASLEPSEEEIRARKEEELRRLLRELYPEEEETHYDEE